MRALTLSLCSYFIIARKSPERASTDSKVILKQLCLANWLISTAKGWAMSHHFKISIAQIETLCPSFMPQQSTYMHEKQALYRVLPMPSMEAQCQRQYHPPRFFGTGKKPRSFPAKALKRLCFFVPFFLSILLLRPSSYVAVLLYYYKNSWCFGTKAIYHRFSMQLACKRWLSDADGSVGRCLQ